MWTCRESARNTERIDGKKKSQAQAETPTTDACQFCQHDCNLFDFLVKQCTMVKFSFYLYSYTNDVHNNSALLSLSHHCRPGRFFLVVETHPPPPGRHCLLLFFLASFSPHPSHNIPEFDSNEGVSQSSPSVHRHRLLNSTQLTHPTHTCSYDDSNA
jgi:hypothetical protein